MRMHPGAPFLLRFALFAAAFYGFAWTTFYQERVLAPVAGVQAWLSGGILWALGEPLVVRGNLISALPPSPPFALEIRQGCDAAEATALFVAATLAFAAPWRARAGALLAGVAMIFVLNVARVASLFLIGRYAEAWFHTAHVDLWPAMILIDAVGLWVLWVRYVARRPGQRAAS
jgi:exosortase H (IPTLxxWG-CTERM-specific)